MEILFPSIGCVCSWIILLLFLIVIFSSFSSVGTISFSECFNCFFFLSLSSPESDSLVDNVESKNVLTIFSFYDSLMYESCWCDEKFHHNLTILFFPTSCVRAPQFLVWKGLGTRNMGFTRFYLIFLLSFTAALTYCSVSSI